MDLTTKTYSSRDSATALLKKMGVAKIDYNKFIDKANGKYTVKVHLVTEAQAEMTSIESRIAAIKKVRSKKPAKRTVSGACRELILAGRSNDEVWAAVKAEFKLADGKKSYPSWYRSDLKRQGLLK